MTDSAAPAAVPPDEPVARLPSGLPLGVLAAAGAAAALVLSTAPPPGPGARTVFAASTLLAAFDTLWFLLLARPGVRSLPETLALLAAGTPFHAVLAAEAGASSGHLAASCVLALAWSGAGLAASRGGAAATAAIAFAAFGLPLAAYGASEFLLRTPLRALFLASPATGPVILARSAPACDSADAVPAVIAAAVVASCALLGTRGRTP